MTRDEATKWLGSRCPGGEGHEYDASDPGTHWERRDCYACLLDLLAALSADPEPAPAPSPVEEPRRDNSGGGPVPGASGQASAGTSETGPARLTGSAPASPPSEACPDCQGLRGGDAGPLGWVKCSTCSGLGRSPSPGKGE